MLIKTQSLIKEKKRKKKKKKEKSVPYLYLKCLYHYFDLNFIKRIFGLSLRLSIIAFDVCHYFAIISTTFDEIDDE